MSISMKGSGIYSYDITLAVDCSCNECEGCGHAWDKDFRTDDDGNVDIRVTCPKCNHKFNFSHEASEAEYEDDYDRFYDK
jgi:RNase P subunit RPR2